VFIISTEVWQQKRYRTIEVKFECIVKAKTCLWWEIVGTIEAIWAPTLGPKFSVELYCFRRFYDLDLWTWPCCSRVHEMAGAYVSDLQHIYPSSTIPFAPQWKWWGTGQMVWEWTWPEVSTLKP